MNHSIPEDGRSGRMGKCLVLGLWISYRPTGSWTDNGYKLTGLRSVALQGANSSLDFRREKKDKLGLRGNGREDQPCRKGMLVRC